MHMRVRAHAAPQVEAELAPLKAAKREEALAAVGREAVTEVEGLKAQVRP